MVIPSENSTICEDGGPHDFHRRPKQDDFLRNLKVWVCINCGGVHYDKVEVPVEVVDTE